MVFCFVLFYFKITAVLFNFFNFYAFSLDFFPFILNYNMFLYLVCVCWCVSSLFRYFFGSPQILCLLEWNFYWFLFLNIFVLICIHLNIKWIIFSCCAIEIHNAIVFVIIVITLFVHQNVIRKKQGFLIPNSRLVHAILDHHLFFLFEIIVQNRTLWYM